MNGTAPSSTFARQSNIRRREFLDFAALTAAMLRPLKKSLRTAPQLHEARVAINLQHADARITRLIMHLRQARWKA
jgi:hypothetical protein